RTVRWAWLCRAQGTSSRADLDRDLAARVTSCQVDEGFRDSVEIVSPLDHRLQLSRRNKAAQQDEAVLFQAGDEHGHDMPASTDRSQTDIEKMPNRPPPSPPAVLDSSRPDPQRSRAAAQHSHALRPGGGCRYHPTERGTVATT